MLDALRTRGYHGVGLSELLATAGAPKGVLYHHFPGGKTELALAAIAAVIDQLTAHLDKVFQRAAGQPAEALALWMAGAQKVLEGSGYERGCPLAAVALESTPQDLALRSALAAGFSTIRERLATEMARAGIEPGRARSLAALIVSAYEGALLQARVASDVQAMQDTTAALTDLVRLSLPASAPPPQDAKS
ncbi:MAG: TetR/AcrR family transcriptional regulator [Ramlibacter sp.]|nr:TetR/AcrR family transcriptional regulator [Ramlibacter sp.]